MQPQSHASTCGILLVDDDDDVRESVQAFLEQEGFSVTAARNGEEALQELKHAPLPSLMLLDLVMPVLNGEGFLEKLTHLPQFADIPVMLVSASLSAPSVRAAFSQVVDVVSKPYKPELLLRKIAVHLRGAADC